VQWSTFLYAALLLVIVLVIPGGIADLLDYKNRRPLTQHREIVPRPELLSRVLGDKGEPSAIRLAILPCISAASGRSTASIWKSARARSMA
jgi:hypothetical protein